ncbi:hypothetical protein RFI_31074, partial [Reticulomyxa filosa]
CQQKFETHVRKLFINCKLLNEELGIIQFIAERIHDNNPIFLNLKSRLFRIIESSKNNNNVNIAAANVMTILNSANIDMDYQNWSNVKISYAILDCAFLEGTNFGNANFDHVRFYQTCLTNVNFTNASMNDIYCGEYPNLEGHSDLVRGIQFSPHYSKIVSCSKDKSIWIWDVSSGTQRQLFEGHSNVWLWYILHPNGLNIISYSKNKSIRIWDIISSQQIQILEGHTAYINGIQFSPDGSEILSYSNDNTLRLWSSDNGKIINVTERNSVDYIWKMDTQGGLSMEKKVIC